MSKDRGFFHLLNENRKTKKERESMKKKDKGKKKGYTFVLQMVQQYHALSMPSRSLDELSAMSRDFLSLDTVAQ